MSTIFSKNKNPQDPGFKVHTLSHQLMASNYRQSTKVNKVCQFGLEALDDGLVHIFDDDLILIGAPTGAGKTQLCTHFAVENAKAGKKVYYVALEASENEIKDRILYRVYSKLYYDDLRKIESEHAINFLNWSAGLLDDVFEKYAIDVESKFQGYPDMIKVVSRTSEFNLNSLERLVTDAKISKPDLFIIDHAHYFDHDAINENKALKDITMACRDITQIYRIPVILIAHLRKKSKDADPVAGLEEFHGSSDLTKIATRVITMSQGPAKDARVQTYFRVTKDRRGSQLTRYHVACEYSLELQDYVRPGYAIGRFVKDRTSVLFQPVTNSERPKWAKNSKPLICQT